MRSLRALAAAGALVVLVLGGAPSQPRITLTPVDDVEAVLASVAPGATIELAPGTYAGPWSITREVTIAGAGARLVGGDGDEVVLSISADDAAISGLEVVGGSSGIVVREAEGVVLEDVSISGAGLHGIEVVDAAATVTRARVTGLIDPLAQGIEIRNSDGRPDTVVRDSRVIGGMEGIVTHVSEVVFARNVVSDTTMRGIVVTEMSDGVVTDNRVLDAAGAGFYCGDMSRCSFERNQALGVTDTGGGTSEAGWGLVVTYHASAWSGEDRFSGVAGDVHASLHGKMLARSPLDPGSLSDIAVPGAISLAVTVALMIVASKGARPLARRLRVREGAARFSVLAALAVALVVQTFHMVEHVLQVHRVTVDHVPSRGGLAGPGVDTEWVHLVYNLVLLAVLVAVALSSRGAALSGTSALVGAVLIQSWHGVEHVVKVFQHVTTGAKVNPGVIGGQFDLVWFHFTVNLAVYALCLLAAVLWGAALWRNRTAVSRPADPVPV